MKQLLLLTIFFAFSKADSAVPTGSCLWQQGVNTTTKTKLQPLIGKSYTAKYGKYTYTISICGDGKKFNATAQTDDKGAVVKVGDMRYGDLYAGSDWIMLWFFNGDPYGSHCGHQNRSAVIMIKCNRWSWGDGMATALEENTDKEPGKCHYLFEIDTSLICPPQKGLSAGSIFVIIFFVFLAVYLIGGFLYQRCVARAQGWEQFPNRQFWINFGNLQADGCDLLCRCASEDSKQYRNIDEVISGDSQSVPRHEERDDRLLNM